MSKDFEQAYRELAQSEIPDLWNRIEAGLSEKSTPENGQEKNLERKKWIYFRRYAGMAAAALCVALIVPAAVFMEQNRSGKSSNMEMAADQCTMEEGTDTTACAPEDAAEEAVDGMPQEETYSLVKSEADAGAGAGAMQDDIQDSAAGAAWEDVVMEESRENVLQNTEELKESLSSQKQDSLTELADGTVIEKVTVEITGGRAEAGDGNDINETGAVYTAVICKEESGLFEEGEQIEIFVPVYSSTLLMEGETFEVELIYRSDKEYPFMLRGIH